MRIATYNVLGLQGYPPEEARRAVGPIGGEGHIEHYGRVFAQLDAQVLALQEGTSAALMQGLARQLECQLATFPSPTAYPGHVLTAYPVLESRVFSHFSAREPVPPFSRTAGAALLDTGSAGLWVVVVHLHPGDREMRDREADILKDRLEELLRISADLVVLGDFNGGVEERLHLHLKSLDFANAMEAVGGGVRLTMDTVGIGKHRIDHIYASPSLAPRLRTARVVRDAGFRHDGPQQEGVWVHSDHLPVVADFAETGE